MVAIHRCCSYLGDNVEVREKLVLGNVVWGRYLYVCSRCSRTVVVWLIGVIKGRKMSYFLGKGGFEVMLYFWLDGVVLSGRKTAGGGEGAKCVYMVSFFAN